MLASPGPFTTQPMIETVKGVIISSREFSNFCTVSITGNCCLAQDGQATILTPLCLRFKLFKISKPTLISSSGSSASDTLIVSPIPFKRSLPIPIEDLIEPKRLLPASVIPRCKG